VAGLILLIACSNVASLLIARATARQREMGVRMALGAGSGRLFQQMLVEGGIVSVAACLLGAVFALWTTPALVSRLSTWQSLVRLDVSLDGSIFAFLSLVGVLTVLLFGVSPALRASRVAPGEALKSGGTKQTAKLRVFSPLVAGQIAFSFIALFVAGLFLISFANLTSVDVGFDRQGLVVLDIWAKDMTEGAAVRALWQQLHDHLNGLAPVESASLSTWALFGDASWTTTIRLSEHPIDNTQVYVLGISPQFLQTMRIRLLDGREFVPRDVEPAEPMAVIVNETFARHFFPGENPLAKRFFEHGAENKLSAREIVGLAEDAKYDTLRDATPPTIYVPQSLGSSATLQVRTPLDPTALTSLLRTELPRVHPAFNIGDVNLQSTLVDDSILRDRLLALLSGFFACVASMLTAVGIYGVLNYLVFLRTHEIGIRIALGALRWNVVRLVFSDLATLAVIGVAAGLAGAFVLARFITSLLYEVRASDSGSLLLPLALLFLTSALAALPPALRASRVDPMVALRHE